MRSPSGLQSRGTCVVLSPLGNPHLVILGVVENSEDRQEEIDDVEVKTDCSGNLFFHVRLSHNHLRIHQNISRENQRRDARIHQFHCAVSWEEHCHEAKQNQSPKTAK